MAGQILVHYLHDHHSSHNEEVSYNNHEVAESDCEICKGIQSNDLYVFIAYFLKPFINEGKSISFHHLIFLSPESIFLNNKAPPVV